MTLIITTYRAEFLYGLQASLQAAMDAIRQGIFGDPNPFTPLLESVVDGRDHYCLSDE